MIKKVLLLATILLSNHYGYASEAVQLHDDDIKNRLIALKKQEVARQEIGEKDEDITLKNHCVASRKKQLLATYHKIINVAGGENEDPTFTYSSYRFALNYVGLKVTESNTLPDNVLRVAKKMYDDEKKQEHKTGTTK